MPLTPPDTARLRDRHGRALEYLRVSVTDRCDLRCAYCMPSGYRDFEPRESWLAFGEIERVVRLFARLGVSRVRLTGGEPLLRRGITELAAAIAAIPGIDDLSLSTNGTQLAKHAAALVRAGVRRINVSLDTLDEACFREITGRDALPQVLAGLECAAAAGMRPIKINTVVLPGVSERHIDRMVEFCAERGFVLRLIERMPIGQAGPSAEAVDLGPIRRRLQERYGLVDGIVAGGGPARYVQSPDGRLSVGFITPMSQHFCATCNRVRLGVEGTLHLCLGQEHRVGLRQLLRSGAGDDELLEALRAAVLAKPAHHCFSTPAPAIVRVMAKTGG